MGVMSAKTKATGDAGEPAPEDGDIEELSDYEMLLNRESNEVRAKPGTKT